MQQCYEEDIYAEPECSASQYAENLCTDSRNAKDLRRVDALLKFVLSVCMKFNEHAMNLVHHHSLNVTNRMIMGNMIMKNTINYGTFRTQVSRNKKVK